MGVGLLIKNLFNKNRALFVCCGLCVCLCFVFSLYAANFMAKVSILNSDGKCVVITNDVYSSLKSAVEKFPRDKAATFVLNLDDGVEAHIVGYDFPVTEGRKPLSADEILSGRKEDAGQIGKEITLSDGTFHIVGLTTFIDCDFIVSSEALTDDTVIRSITVTNSGKVTPSEFERIVKKSFGNYEIRLPDKIGIKETAEYSSVFLPVILALVAVVAALSLIEGYLLNKLVAPCEVLAFCGYAKSRIFYILSAASLMLLSVPVAAGECIYLVVERVALNLPDALGISVKYFLTFENHIAVILSFTALMFLLLLPVTIRLSARTVKAGRDA